MAMTEFVDVMFEETDKFRINLIDKYNVSSDEEALAIAGMFLYQAVNIFRIVGGSKYAAEVLYATADFEVGESNKEQEDDI
jgi:hypothetical protein